MDPHTANPLLAGVADTLLRGHHPDGADPGRCVHPRCHKPYPCPSARIAAEAAAQAAGTSTSAPPELVGAAGGAAWR
ncbi:MAG TPA: hypothetical protein VGN37_01695 [Actinocatenispora sp.]